MSLPVAILAGGLATRLRPLTEKIPKALVEVAGRPFIEHQVELLVSQQVSEIVLCVGHLGEMIEKHLGDGSRLGARISYSRDGERLMGTGGALRNALPLLGEEFFVLYGDSYLPTDFAAVESAYRVSGKRGLMTVFRNEGEWDRSNMIFEEGVILKYDKKYPSPQMKHIDYGLEILQRNVFENIPPEGAFDLAEFLHDLVADGQIVGYEVHERFYEIGSLDGWNELEHLLKAQNT